MIFTLVLILLLIVFLAFFVGKNLSNVCTFWIFKTFKDLPVAILALICFGAGILVAMLVFFLAKLKKVAREDRINDAKESVMKEQKKALKANKRREQKKKSENDSDKTLLAETNN